MKKLLSIFILGMFLINFTSAVSIGTFKQGEDVELGREIDVLRQELLEIKSCTETSKDWLVYQKCILK